MTWLTRDWLNPSPSAVRPKCSSFASTRNARISRSSTDSHIPAKEATPAAASRGARSAAAGPRAQPRHQAATLRPDATATVLVEGLPGGHIAAHVLEAGGGHLDRDHRQPLPYGGHSPVRGRVEAVRHSARDPCLRALFALTLRALAPPLLAERRDPERRGHDQHGRGEDHPLDPVPGVRDDGHACPAADRIHRPMEVKTTITPSIHSCERTAVPVSG